MAIKVTNLLDAQTCEDAVQLTSLLLRLATARHIDHRLVLLGKAPASLRIPSGIAVTRIPTSTSFPILALPTLRRVLLDQRPDVLHTLGVRAVALTGILRHLGVSVPILATLSDPAEAAAVSRWWRSLKADGIE